MKKNRSSTYGQLLKEAEKIKKRLKTDNLFRKRVIVKSLPYVLLFLFGDKLCCFYRTGNGDDSITKITDAVNKLSNINAKPLFSFKLTDMFFGVACAAGFALFLYLKKINGKVYRQGEEYGSAKLGTQKDIEGFIDRVNPDNNLIFTNSESMSLNPRMPDPLYNRNKNVLVVGGSGSGKTRFYAKPNIMQLNCSYVITDPKGTIIKECGKMLKDNGYEVKVINTVDFEQSMKYNPFAYINSTKEIATMVDALIEGTTVNKQSQGEQFWTDAEKLLYNALIAYILKMGTEEEKNFTTLLNMINEMEVREDNEDYKNVVDLLFEELQEESPDDYSVLQYKKFKLATGKTMKSILITVCARLSRFDIKEVRELMEEDELQLDLLGDRKTALFIVTSDTTKAFSFIGNILYTQLFNLLVEKADKNGGSLKMQVHCIMDEFANLGKIPEWEILISTIRSRGISASMILQSLAQIKSIYDKDADTICDNCDSFLFLGGKGRDTLKEISEMLGKQTIDTYNSSKTKGNSPSDGVNYQKIGRELFTPDELGRLPGNKCILSIKGVKPFYSDKYKIERHKRYRQLSDFDKKNTYDLKREISLEPTLTANTHIEHYAL